VIKYILYPGRVISNGDGNVVGVTGMDLVRLYGVKPSECVYHDKVHPRQLKEPPYSEAKKLAPRRDGVYRKPDGSPNA
jgi:hypothetical protein